MAAFWEIAAHLAYNMLSKCQFSFHTSVFFLIAPFPDHCLLVPFNISVDLEDRVFLFVYKCVCFKK